MVWLIKADANGEKVWDKIFGGSKDDWGNSVQQTSDGGYIITGATKSHGEDGRNALWLIKTDVKGDESWDKIYGRSDDTIGYSVQQTNDGGYIIAGSKLTYAERYGEIWLIKTDFNGNTTWDKNFGGLGDDVGKSVQQTRDGGYIIVGSKAKAGGGTLDVLLTRVDASGDEEWEKTFGGSGWNEGKAVQQTVDGGYIITGSTHPYGVDHKGNAVWLIKTDSNGNKAWDKTIN